MTAVAAIRVELIGDAECRANGARLRAKGSPVLALCRKLIAAGSDPTTRLECYRGDTLCLVVRSIGEAATIEVSGSGTGFIKQPGEPRIAPPMRRDENSVPAP